MASPDERDYQASELPHPTDGTTRQGLPAWQVDSMCGLTRRAGLLGRAEKALPDEGDYLTNADS